MHNPLLVGQHWILNRNCRQTVNGNAHVGRASHQRNNQPVFREVQIARVGLSRASKPAGPGHLYFSADAMRGNPDPAVVKRLAGDATITTLAKREFEPRTLRFLQAMGLVAIPSAISSRGLNRPFYEPIPLRRSRFPAAMI